MPCTTLLVGKDASYDGSTIIARNEDSFLGDFNPKKLVYIKPEDQPRRYRSVLTGLRITLPDDPMGYSAVPNADPTIGNWSAQGVNEANVSMTATETITTNPRVLGADPFPKVSIGEEDMVTIVLPYIKSAREGVERMGKLLARYGTYESNAMAFSDVNEIWWLETIGGHHWIAKRVPDDMVVIMPNQLGIDDFDLDDAFGARENHMCSPDLREFIADNHLDLNTDGLFNPRLAFGSHGEYDHDYNTPRAWDMGRQLCPTTYQWYGEGADFDVYSDDIPWMLKPERKVTIEDVKDVLSSHFQGTDYDPYGIYGDPSVRGSLRPIGMNRNGQLSITQLRPYAPKNAMAIQWMAFSCNCFNAAIPFYANVTTTPDYVANCTTRVDTDNLYWAMRLISVMADAHYRDCITEVEHYQEKVQAKGHEIIKEWDAMPATRRADAKAREAANQAMADFAKQETDALLDKILYICSGKMINSYNRTDG